MIVKMAFWAMAVSSSALATFFLFWWVGTPAKHEMNEAARICGRFGGWQLLPALLLWYGIYARKYEIFQTFGKRDFASILIWQPQMIWISILFTSFIFIVYGIVAIRSYPYWGFFLM